MENQKLNIKALGTKFQSKHEMYRFLTTEADKHLPPQKECSIYFIRDIISGEKKVSFKAIIKYLKALYNDEVKVKIVPQFESLRVKDLYWFLENKWTNGIEYLPDEYEKKSLNRQWLWNLCKIVSLMFKGNTLNQEEFENLISLAVKERQDKFVEKHNMEIETDPRIVKAFENSKSLTSRYIAYLILFSY